MRPGNFSAALGQLNGALKDWRVRREETLSGWEDTARSQHEELHTEPLDQKTLQVIRKMEHTAQVMTQMGRELSS